MTDADKIKAIQQRMKQVRRELGNDVASSARDITDWRNFVKATPWICVAAAAAVGYFLVPKGPPVVRLSGSDVQTLKRQNQAILVKASNGAKPKSGIGMRLGKMLVSHVGGLVLRSAMAYVGNRFAHSRMPNASQPAPAEDAPF